MEINKPSSRGVSAKKEQWKVAATSSLVPKTYSSSSTQSSEDTNLQSGKPKLKTKRRKQLAVPPKKGKGIQKLTKSGTDSEAEYRKVIVLEDSSEPEQSPRSKGRTRIKSDNSSSSVIFTPPCKSDKNRRSRKISISSDEADYVLFRDIPKQYLKKSSNGTKRPRPSEPSPGEQRTTKIYKSLATEPKHKSPMQNHERSTNNLQFFSSTSRSDILWDDFVKNMNKSQRSCLNSTEYCTQPASSSKDNDRRRKEQSTESVIGDRQKRGPQRRKKLSDDKDEYCYPELEDSYFEKGSKSGERINYKEFRRLRKLGMERLNKGPSSLKISTPTINILSSPDETPSPFHRTKQTSIFGDEMRAMGPIAGSSSSMNSPILDIKEHNRMKRQLMKDRNEIEAKYSGTPSKLRKIFKSSGSNSPNQVKKNVVECSSDEARFSKSLVKGAKKDREDNSTLRSTVSNAPTVTSMKVFKKPVVYKGSHAWKIVVPNS